MAVTRVKITSNDVEVAANVTDKLNGNYDRLGGFTIADSKFVFAARNKNDIGRLCTIPINGSKLTQGPEVDIKHGNDLAYYNNSFYLALGNESHYDYITGIYQFSSDLKPSRIFNYVSRGSGLVDGLQELDYISKICHYSGDKFIVGNGAFLALCKLNLAAARFEELGRFNLDISELNRNDCTRSGQGMYYQGGYLYAVFSYNVLGDPYTKNDIAIYSVTGSGTTLNTTLKKIYEFDSDAALVSGLALFELEGIAAADGTFYVDTNQRVKDTGTSCDYIYSIGALSV